MNYITSCPNCDTQFLLNDELIKAYRGKVQCGHCEHVFNAKNRLTEVADDITNADEYQASLVETAVVETETTFVNEDGTTSDATLEKKAEINQATLLNNPTDVDYYISSPTPEAEPTSETESKNQSETPTEEQKPVVELDNIFNKKSAKEPKQYSFLVGFFSFLLVITLILQSTYFLRNEIARQFPPTKPLLERACIPLKCTIDLAKNLDLITIGDSDMQEDDTYQSVIKFSSSLKNNANYPQAYPNIELTLTDTDDRPVIKKLITPKGYLVPKEKIKHGLDPHETATIKLSFRADDPSVASYRILLLY
jgi:predicted Zn finger-like uncharacterized protein